MRRREVIAGLGAVAWPLAVRAQQPPLPLVGFLNGASATELKDRVAAFRDGLAEVGRMEGRNVEIDYRWGDGRYDRLPELATALVRRNAAVIAATGGVPAVRAAKAASSEIPIVFTMGADPVEAGLVASLNRPGGNITGITLLSAPIVSKRIGLLRELNPRTKVIAVLLNPTSATGEIELTNAHEAVRALGWRVSALRATAERDLDSAFEKFAQEPVDALVVTTDPIFESWRDHIVSLARRYAVPTIYSLREYPHAGGLMSYGASITNVYRQTGMYVGRILNGERAADLPVQLPTKFELVLNLRTARALGLDLPAVLLAIADEVID
jgi:putative tryptophan/tyrosine transport system substrate-binding protein